MPPPPPRSTDRGFFPSTLKSPIAMPRGAKAAYSANQKRKASHVAASARKRGASPRRAKAIAWKTVNKQDGGAKKKRA